jgi:hypothetical protein
MPVGFPLGFGDSEPRSSALLSVRIVLYRLYDLRQELDAPEAVIFVVY